MAAQVNGERVLTVNIYDAHASNANFKVKPITTAAEICKIILSKRDILASESKYFSVVLVVTAFSAAKKVETHCLRTLKPNEFLLDVEQTIRTKMAAKCGIADESKLERSEKWYFKDMRSNPIDLGSTSDICGEYDSDEDEEITPSDLSYLAKSERKGFLLKRSNTDFNLWRRWYCVLMDQLWCVDTTREIARAKCVHLSGMIRYREGQKTLDQLQIIIINSADGRSHFFRAFNLIDQKKWLQDLNIKTRIAPDNDTFAMAEMIITDEVDARCFRLTRQLEEVLDQPVAMEAIALRRAVELNSTNGGALDPVAVISSPAPVEFRSPLSRTNSVSLQPPKPNNNFMLDAVQPVKGAESADANESPPSGSPVRRLGVRNGVESVRLAHPRGCSGLSLEALQICDRVEGHLLVHELHKDSRVVAEVAVFVLDVQRYREVLRVDLNLSVARRHQAARDVYLRHVLPQLQHADLGAYPEFSHEVMQLTSGPSGSAKGVTPDSPTRLSSLSNKASVAPVSPNSSKRSEYASRVRNRSATSNVASSGKEVVGSTSPRPTSAEGRTSASAATNWGVDVTVLMRVHSILFEMHQRLVEAQNGLVTQDPVQLLKFSAGSSKFRSGRDRTASTSGAAAGTNGAPAAPIQSTPSSSYLSSWFGFSSTPSSGSASPTPSRKGSDAAQLAASLESGGAGITATAVDGSSRDRSTSATPVGIAEVGLAVADPSTLGSSSADDAAGLRGPPVTLFDEVVTVLVQKLS